MFGINYNGLRKRESYDELVNYIETDPNKIRYPNSTATFIERSHYVKHLGGEDYIEMEQQQLRASKEKLKELIIQEMTTSGDTRSLLRSQISAQSIQVPQTVTQQQTPYFTPKSQISTQNLAPMQTEMPELLLPSISSEIDQVVEREKNKRQRKDLLIKVW